MDKSIFIAFLVATSVAYNQARAEEEEISSSPLQYAEVPAVIYDHELLQQMTTQRFRFLQDCSDKLSSKCSIEMTKGLINDKPISEGCCKEILKIERDCHEGLVNFELKDVADEILSRSRQIWNQCVQTSDSLIGAPRF